MAKEFKLKPETAAFMEKFPPKAGESATNYARRIEEMLSALRRAEVQRTADARQAQLEKDLEAITPKQPKAPKTPRQPKVSKAAAPDPSAPKPITRISAMKAQILISRGITAKQVAKRINLAQADVDKIYLQRVSPHAFKDVYHATGKIGGKGRIVRYTTTDENDPNIKKSAEYRPSGGVPRARSGLKPGEVSGAGLPYSEKGFRLPLAPKKGARITEAQKKEVRRIVTGGYGVPAIRGYVSSIGLPATTISDLEKIKKAAGVRGPTASAVSARRKAEAAAESAAEARRLESVARQEAAAAERARIRAIPSFKEAAKNMRYVGRPGRASPIARRNGRVGPQSTRPIIPVETVRRVPEVNMPAHIRQGREHQRMRRAVIQPITVGGKEERYVSRQKVIGYTDSSGKFYPEGGLKEGEYQKIFNEKGKIRKGFKEVTEPVYSTRTVGGTTKMRGLRVLQGHDTPRKPFVAPPPSAKPIVGGRFVKDVPILEQPAMPQGSVAAGAKAVESALGKLYGPEAGKGFSEERGGEIRQRVARQIEDRLQRGIPVDPKTMEKLYAEGTLTRDVMRGINGFVPDPHSPLLNRAPGGGYEMNPDTNEPKTYRPSGTRAADEPGKGKDTLSRKKERELARDIESGDTISDTPKMGALSRMPGSRSAESGRHEDINDAGQKGMSISGGGLSLGGARPIPAGAIDETKRGYATGDIDKKLNQIAITNPQKAAEIAASIGIKDFDPVKAAARGAADRADADKTIADVRDHKDRQEAARNQNERIAKDRAAAQEREASGVPKLQKGAIKMARALFADEPAARKGDAPRGGRFTGAEIVEKAKSLAATGFSTPELQQQFASGLPGGRGRSADPSSAQGQLLSEIANNRELAAKIIPETINGKPRDEYLDQIKNKLEGKNAPAQIKAGGEPAEKPKPKPQKADSAKKKKLLKKISEGLRKVAQQRGAAVPDQAAAADAPKRRGRPPKEKIAPPAAPPAGGDGGGPKESKGGAGKLPPVTPPTGGSGGGGGGSSGGMSVIQRIAQKFREGGDGPGMIKKIEGLVSDPRVGITKDQTSALTSKIQSHVAAIQSQGVSEFSAYRSIGVAGGPGTILKDGTYKPGTDIFGRIVEMAKDGTIDSPAGQKIIDAAATRAIEEKSGKAPEPKKPEAPVEDPKKIVEKAVDDATKEKKKGGGDSIGKKNQAPTPPPDQEPAEKAAPKKKQAPKKPAKKKAPTKPAPKPEKQSKSGPKKESPAKGGKAGLPDPNSRLGQLYQGFLDVGFGKRQAIALAKAQEPMTPAQERRVTKINNEGMEPMAAMKQVKAESQAKAAAKEQAAAAKAAPKAAPKAKAAPKSKAKAAPKPKTAPAPKAKAEPKAEKKPAAAPKTKAIKPMTQEKQRGALASAEGYKNGSAREAYKSLLKKGVDPQTAKQIVEDGRGAGIKGKQLVDYSNRRQKGMDHETAKAAATAKKVGGAPSGPGKAGGKAAAGSSGGSGKPPKGTTSGGRFARGPRGSSGGMSPGIFGQAASGADRGVVGAVKNSIGQITQSLLTAQVIGQVGSIIKQITGGLIGFNMKLEESTIAFKTLFINEQRALGTFMGDTTQATIKANILTKAIQDFANVTPFRFGELVTAAERMKAFGFETKEILPSLQGIGDAVAALGGEDDKLRRITYALGQMKQAGRVYQNDMMQLSNAGIAGYEILAKGLIEEFIKTGRVMVGESGNLYKYNTETIDQVVTDIVKNKGQGVYKVMSSQSNKLIEIFNDLTTEPVEKIRNMTKRGSIDGAAAARYIIKGMEKTYQGGMEALARTMKGAISTVQDTSQYLIAVSFKPIYDHIRNFFYNAGQFMMKAGGKRIAEGIAKAITPIGNAAAEAFPKVGSFFAEMISAIMTASGNFTKSMAKIQVGAQTLVEYIKDNLIGGIKSVLEILKTDFGQAAIAAVAAMRIIQSVAAANPIVIALGAIVMAMGAVTSGMNKFIKTGSITRDSIETITEEEQNTALAGIQIKEAFIEIGNAIKKAKKQLGPSLTRIFTELAKVLSNVGSKVITVIVDAIKAISDVITLILNILSRMPGALSVALAAFVAFKVGAAGLSIATTSMNALATSMLAVAGAANAIKTGGAVGIIGSILGGGLVQSGARALAGIATGAQIASVAAQTQAFNTGGAVRKLALGEAASSVAITGGGIRQILGGGGKSAAGAAAGAADDVVAGTAAVAAPAAKTSGAIATIKGVVSGLGQGISKLAGVIRMSAGKFALIAFAALTLIKHIGKVGELFGSFFGMLGRGIGLLAKGAAAVARFISEIPLVGPILSGITNILGDFFQAFDDLIDISINSVIDFFDSMFPEDSTEAAIRQVKEMNEEIARLIEMGYEAEEAKEIAEAIFLIKKAIETETSNDPRIQDVNWGMGTSIDPSMATQVAADGTPIVASASGLKTIGPGEWISPDQVRDLRDNTDEIIANLDDTARAAFVEAINKARNIRDEYKQMLIDAGMSEEQAAKLSGDRYKGYLDQITGTVKRISASGDIEKIIPSITDLTNTMAIGFGDAADGAEAFGVSIDKLQNGDVLAYITDVNGVLEEIRLQGETAANASQIETIIEGIAGQTRDQAVETGTVPNQAAADKVAEDTKRFYNPKFADAIEGFYTNPITGAREFLGRTIAVRKLLADIKVVAGEVDLGQIYSETVESKLEKAKSAIEKIKAALDPIVDRILSRIRNAAEKQFSDRIENVTKILEEQRDAEIDAIQVRVDGINTTYGILEDEIKAQEKKNRVIQIEKTLLDARKNVADAAIAAYGEDVDPIAAAIARREAEISMTETVKDAEFERKKLALDEQQNTIAGIQSIFDIRIEIVTDALEQEKMAFFENIDDIVAKIKEGTITGAAAVAALSAAFQNFGLTIPSTAQAIAASGTNTIGSLFTKIISAIDAYRNKLLQVKAIEDTLGDDMADDPPTQEEIDYMKAIAEQEAERKRKSAIGVGKSTAFESIGSVFNEMLRQSMYGKDGKPIAKSLRDKRDKEYNVQAKALTASLPKAGDYSEAALAKMSAGWLAWTTWLSSVDLMSAVPRAKGGPVTSRGQYLVGEKGPELITMGNGSGQVISNFYVKRLTDTFKKLNIGNPAMTPNMAYNMGGGGKAELSVTINNPQVRSDSDIDKIVDAVNKSQMRMARRLGYS